MKASSVFLIEILRIALFKGGYARYDYIQTYQELMRRGVLSDLEHFEHCDGMLRPTDEASRKVRRTLQNALDMNLLIEYRPRNRNYNHYMITEYGKSTVLNWDDPRADCLY
jgi:hypothetical protein